MSNVLYRTRTLTAVNKSIFSIFWPLSNHLGKKISHEDLKAIIVQISFFNAKLKCLPGRITWSAAMETSNTPTSPSSTTTISSSSVASNTARTPPSPSSGSIGSRTRGWISSWHSETSIASRGARIGQKMPDLLIDQSPSVVGAKRVWIGGIVNYINF